MGSSSIVKLFRLRQFLISRNWTQISTTSNYQKFTAPQDLVGDYTLTIPSESSKDSDISIPRVLNNLAVLYEISNDELVSMIEEEQRILSVQMIGNDNEAGTIPLVQFEAVIDRLKRTLLDVASFVVSGEQNNKEVPMEALTYIEQCKFLQTEVGSFVAKIGIPSGTQLKQGSLFSQDDSIASDDVNTRLESIFELVTEKIFKGDKGIYENKYMEESMDLLCVNALENIYGLYEKSGADQINIRILGSERTSTYESGELTDEKFENFDGYVKYIREHLVENLSLNVVGRIVELRSRNPSSKRNYVKIDTAEYGGASVAIILDEEQYSLASSAHLRGRNVRVVGRARKMKTQIKIVELTSFTEV